MRNYDKLIEVAELQAMIGTAGCRVVDCRFDLMQPEKGREEYLAGHIPGAVFADLDKDLAGPVTATTGRHPLPDIEVFKATLEGLGIGDDTQVVAYDYASGALAARLWWMLRWFGRHNVAVLNGGINAWLAAGGALETAVPEYSAASLTASPDAGLVASTDEISAALGEGGDLRLVDARDAPRFNGEREPIDDVAGHIPGALNLPFSAGINEDGTWKSPGELKILWADLFGSDTAPPFTVMCGSGVTACHLALAAEIAGLELPRVYVGSWSEWIRDPERPVATG